MPLRVSVVIPTYNRAALLPRLIRSLEDQTLPRDEFEVLIIDDGSTDQTADVLASLAARSSLQLRTMALDHNRGCPAAARNVGWRAARASVIAFTDDDCAPAPEWLKAGLSALDEGAGVVQGKTIPDPVIPRRRWYASQEIETFSKRYETCNIFYRTDLLRAIGGFDETILFWGDDTLAGWAAVRNGADARFAADAVVFHTVTHPGLGWHLRRARLYRNWATMLRRCPEMREVLHWGVFLRRRDLGLIGALLALSVGPFWYPAFAFVLPYAWFRRPRRFTVDAVVDSLGMVLIDSADLVNLLAGGVKERRLVL